MLPQYVGKDTFFHTNCGNNTTFDCTQRYKAAEFSVSKRMSNRWQMQGSYVWSRLDGAQTGHQHQRHRRADGVRLHQPEQHA